MGIKLYLSQDNNPKKALLRALFVVVLAFLCLFIFGVGFLSLTHLLYYGFDEKSLDILVAFYKRLRTEPLFLWDAYGIWFKSFVEAFQKETLGWIGFLPFLAPVLFFSIIFLAYLKSVYSFGLWFRLNNHFAKFLDVAQMGIVDGSSMVLGKFQEHMLQLGDAASVLCFGEGGGGKTSCVAIPSVLESDESCIVAVDNSGALARYTSGYRAKISKVFYFNWDLKDNQAKGEVYPRWNPLSAKNLPAKGVARDLYINKIARYLISKDIQIDKENYWDNLALLAIECLLSFYICKVEQACANDYFLNEVLEKGRIKPSDRDVLLSYYALMPKKYAKAAIKSLEKEILNVEEYMPIGSWEGIPNAWRGVEANLPMFADWLLQVYFGEGENAENGYADIWKAVLDSMLSEAEFFSYHQKTIAALNQLSCLSKKQRNIIFPMLIEPLMIFRNESIRERLSCGDFSSQDLRGVFDEASGKRIPVTIYCMGATKSSKFINGFFVDVMIRTSLQGREESKNSLMFVLDEFGQLPKFRALLPGLVHGAKNNVSFLMLSNGLKDIEKLYGIETLEEIVSNVDYKVLLADNNQKFSRQLERLAVYGTKSVQIPVAKTGAFLKVKSGMADAHYYRKIAKDILSKRKVNVDTKGYEMILVEGFYHLPIMAKTVFFLKDENLRAKAANDVVYFADEQIVKNRNIQDSNIPKLQEILMEAGVSLNDDHQIGEFLENKYEEAVEKMQITPDKESFLMEDLSMRWKSKGVTQEQKNEPQNKTIENDDWWLEEESFTLGENKVKNPFSS